MSLHAFPEVLKVYHDYNFASIPLLIKIRRFLDAISLNYDASRYSESTMKNFADIMEEVISQLKKRKKIYFGNFGRVIFSDDKKFKTAKKILSM